MDKMTRITITAMEKGSGATGSERIEVLVDAWHDSEPITETRVNEVIGIIEKARMQWLGAAFMEGALRSVRSKLGDTFNTIDRATETLEEAIDLCKRVTQTPTVAPPRPWYRRVLEWRPW